MDAWLPLKDLKVAADGLITAELVIDSASGWFDGHFPSLPVLPGVVLLAVVEEAARRAGLPALREVRKVKFFQAVSPGERLTLDLRPLSPGSQGELGFTFRAGGQRVCQGVAGYGPPGLGPTSEPGA